MIEVYMRQSIRHVLDYVIQFAYGHQPVEDELLTTTQKADAVTIFGSSQVGTQVDNVNKRCSELDIQLDTITMDSLCIPVGLGRGHHVAAGIGENFREEVEIEEYLPPLMCGMFIANLLVDIFNCKFMLKTGQNHMAQP
jgi:hypothetical protein